MAALFIPSYLFAIAYLGSWDLNIPGIPKSLSESSALSTLGTPRSIETSTDHYGQPLTIHNYGHCQVNFKANGTVDIVILTDDHYSTYRGIKVGDSKEAVLKAYGHGTENDNAICYQVNSYEDERGILFVFRDGKVLEISIGNVNLL